MNLHGAEHRDRRRLENRLFRRDTFAYYENSLFPEIIRTAWRVATSPRPGPVAIIVSIPDQLAHVYRGGVRIGVSTCSTGKPSPWA